MYRIKYLTISKQDQLSRLLIYLKLVGFLAFPILLYFVPVIWLNKQQSICLFKTFFDIECYGCGITRAILSAIQLDFESAYVYNHLVVVVLPIFIYIWVKMIIDIIKQIKQKSSKKMS